MVAAPRMRQAGDMTSDDELLADFLTSRDDAAFERLVVRYGPMVLRVCRDILGDHSAADDAFQATFLVFFRQSATIRDRNSVGRWLYEVACRVARRARTGDSKRRARERWALTMEAATTPDHEAADREWRPILHEEIRNLPAKLLDAIVLCYLEGLTVEAAAQLACPSGTLKSRLTKARDLLRTRLTRRGLAASVVLLLLFAIEHPVAAAEVAEPLLRATVQAAMGDAEAISGAVEALATADEAARRRRMNPRLGASLIVLLALFGSVRWSMATATAPPAQAPRLTNFIVPGTSAVVRWARSATGYPVAPRHCHAAH